tara:strand:+ start:594 stop:842 length:249 start_codon:yes stop_codon:yes gene_type:complete
MVQSLLDIFENKDIHDKILKYLIHERYSIVMNEFKKKWFDRSPALNVYKSGRKIHPARKYLKDNVGPLIKKRSMFLMTEKYY